jgi:hypothetical protein
MYYGHIGGNNLVITNIYRKQGGYKVRYFFKKSNRTGTLHSESASEMVNMIDHIPSYYVSYDVVATLCEIESRSKFAKQVIKDLHNGKAEKIDLVYGNI